MPWPVSLCLLCHNEEKNLERFFAHVRPHVREILVIDSGSTDRSVEIARRHADILILHPLDNFASQRNLASSKALNRRVLHLDADETMTPEMIDAVEILFNRGDIDQHAAYCFPRMTFDETGRLRKIVESYPGFHYRLYDRERCRWIKPVHETLQIDGPKRFIPCHILHYPDYSRIPSKLALYTDLSKHPVVGREDSAFRSMWMNFIFHARALFIGLGMWKRPADFLFACHWLIHQARVRISRSG